MHSVQQIMKRHEAAQRRKDHWRQIYEDCYEFGLPQRNLYDGYYEGGGAPGQNKMVRVFDSTAINAVQRFANRIQSGLFPPYANWCRLEPGADIPEDRRIEAQAALDIYSEKMFRFCDSPTLIWLWVSSCWIWLSALPSCWCRMAMT